MCGGGGLDRYVLSDAPGGSRAARRGDAADAARRRDPCESRRTWGQAARKRCVGEARAIVTRRVFELQTLEQAPHVDHAAATARFIGNEARTDWHDGALWFVREKRDGAAAALPEWEVLREL